ncbi:hypothetical protein F5146DRAFT_1228503 [Armillaria mellea]|nr:hypothetical protein F5146DRAFT_1228503 [Armillaria mellea]
MSAKVHVELPTRITSIGPRLSRTNTPIDRKEKMAESVDVIDGQEREQDVVQTKPSSPDSPLSDLDTSTNDDRIPTPKVKTCYVLVSQGSAKAEWPTVAKNLGHRTRNHGENRKDYQTGVLQNIGSDLLKGPKHYQEVARLAMDAGEDAHMVVTLDQTDYGARLKKQGETKGWSIGNADLSAWGVEPVLRPVPCQRCADAGMPCMFTNGRRPNNSACRFCSMKLSRCNGTTPKSKHQVAKEPDSLDHGEGSASFGKRKSGDEALGNIQVVSKKYKFDLFADDDSFLSSTPRIHPTDTDSQSTKSVPALISELWTKETKKYEVRIQELKMECDRFTSVLVVTQRELQAAKQQNMEFKGRGELLEAEIATLKAEKTMLEERMGSTRKALEDLKRKFLVLVKVIQTTDEIMTGFDEISAQ